MNLLLSILSIILLLLLPFINIFHDNAFSSENKTLKYIFEPFLKLNGTDFYDIESNDQLQLEDFTLGTWFRSNQSSFDEPAHIVNKGGFNNERTGKNMNYGVWMNTDGTITAGFEVDSGKNIEILSKKKYNDGEWHYVLVRNNSTVLRMDIDGHTIENLETTRTPDATGDQPLRLGANSLDLDKYFNGEVDELRVWNRGLAINELSQIYTNRNFTTNGQVEYLNFGKNIMDDNDKKRADDNVEPKPQPPSKTNATKEGLTTTTKKEQPPIVQPKTSNQTTTVPTQLSNNTSNNTAAIVKEDKINLALENLNVNRSVTNSVVIKGDIKNNSTLDLYEVKVYAEYYDKTGTLLEKVEHFITSPSYILKPNEQVSFDILEVLGFGFHKLGNYNIVASGETIN